jgi:hypothetical protein
MANIALITNNILSDSGTAITSVLSGSGTTNYLSKFTGSTALGNSIIYDDGTAVGIGTTSPTAKLTVVGAGTGVALIGDPGFAGTNYTGISLNNTLSTSSYNILSAPNDATLYINRPSGASIRFREANGTDQMIIQSGGNVGIGISTPGVKFVNSGATAASGPTLGSGTVGSQALLSANGLYGMYSGVSTSGDVWHQVQRNDANTAVYNLLLQPSGGYVGIGTTSPLVALDVRGTVIITNQAGSNYDENLRLPQSTSGYAALTLGGSIAASGTSAAQWTLVKFPTSNNFSIRNNSSDHVTVFPTGNLAIGNSTDAGYKLDVVNGAIRIVYSTFAGIEYHNTAGTWEGYIGTESGSGNLRYNSRQGAHTWYYNSTATMTLTSGGNLGIGTTSPSQKLDVNGVIRAGSASSVSGSNILWGVYGNGALTTFGSMYSNGGPVIGYAVSPSTSGSPAFLSSTGITISRGAYFINGGLHSWFSGASQTVAIGSSVSMSELMRIESNGNLLIGTTTDSGHKLQVNGTAIFYGSPTISVSNLPQLTLNDTLQSHNWVIRSNGTSLFFIDNGNNRVWIGGTGSGNAGNVGIGTTSTSYKLDVNGTARVVTSLRVGADGNTYTSIDNGSFNISRISDGGNGIVSIQGPTVLNANRSIGRFNGREGVQLSYDTAGRLQVFQTTTTIGLGANDTSLTNDTSTILRLDGSKTASSAIARGANFVPTLVAAANSDVLVGLDITPTFTNGAFTGVINYGIRTSGDIAFASSATRYLTMQSPSTSGSGGNMVIQSASANTSGTGGNLYLYVGGGAGGPGPGKIYIGNNNGWDVAYVTGILTVSSTGPNTGDVLRVSGGGRNALTIAWDNLTPFMSYSLVSGRQSRFLNSSSYYFDNNFLIGTTTDGGYKLNVNGNGNFILGNSGYIRLQSGSGQRHGYIQSAFSNFLFSNNIYYDGSNWRYDQNGYGAQIQTETLSSGVIAFNTFASGTGGGIATIIESMRIVNNGNILMGDTNDLGFKLQVTGKSIFSDTIIQDYGNNSSALSGITSYITQSTLDSNYTNGSYSGETISGQLASTVIAGQVVAMRASTLQWELADASTAASIGKNMIGIACYGGNNGDTITILLRGFFASDTYYNNSGSYGVPMYLNAGTSGSLTDVAPSTTGNIVRIVGHIDNYSNSNSCAVLRFNPDNSWLVI